MGGRLVDKAKSFYFQDGGAPLCLSVDELNAGWNVRPATECQELPFSQVRHLLFCCRGPTNSTKVGLEVFSAFPKLGVNYPRG